LQHLSPRQYPIVALAASATAADPVSANIVGYMKLDVGAISLIGPMFVDVNVGASSLQLGAIVPNENYDSDYDSLQFVDQSGNLAWSATYWGEDYGWWDGPNDANEYAIDIGTGFIANTRGANVSYCIAGEVRTAATDIPVAPGVGIIGNALPIPMALSNLVPNASYDSDYDSLQFLGSDGSLMWSAIYWGDDYGWWDGPNDVNAYSLDSGVFVFASVSTPDVVFSLPALVVEED